MTLFAFAPIRKAMLVFAAAALAALGSASTYAQDDPPAQAGRLAAVSGLVSIQPAGADNWGQAMPNLPLGPGDRIFTDTDGRAEIQVGQSYLRIGPNSDVTLVGLSPYGISFGIAQGSAHLHVLGLWPGQYVHLNTPNGSASLAAPGELRLDVLSADQATIFTGLQSSAYITGASYAQDLYGGQALELVGSNPVYPQWLSPSDPDNLDGWSQARDRQILHAESNQYVSAEIPGVDELDGNGYWLPGTEYGTIWFPNVPDGWAPYHYGHWVNHAPWGWVWVEDESWGYAPFHYGRWISLRGHWAWVPGPRAAHPVWSPALVAFAGGIQVGGRGISAWFPLGPGEPYRPWYRCSPRYMDQVNISNMMEGPHVHVLASYAGFNFGGAVFANHASYSAMRHEDFAAGRPVREAPVVIDVHVIEHITIIERPEPPPPARPVAYGPPPSRPVSVHSERPVLMNEQGKLMAARPGAQAMEPPVKAAPQVRALPGRTVIAPPPGVERGQGRVPVPAATQVPATPQTPQPHGAPGMGNGQGIPVHTGGKPWQQQDAAPAQKPSVTAPAAPAARPQPTVPVAQPVAVPAAKPVVAPPAARPMSVPAVAPPAAKPAPAPAAAPATAKPAAPAATPDKGKKGDNKGRGEKGDKPQ